MSHDESGRRRRVLVVLAWAGAVGAILDSAITVLAAWEIATTPTLAWNMTVDAHLRAHLSFLYWLKSVGYALAPDRLVDWLFELPALLYFPFRILINLLFGWWMLRWAKRLQNRN